MTPARSFRESPAQVLTFPNNRFEIFAFAAESRAFATGQQGATGEKFRIVDSVNLNDPKFAFGSAHKGHSAQFRSTVQKRWTYWTQALDDMDTHVQKLRFYLKTPDGKYAAVQGHVAQMGAPEAQVQMTVYYNPSGSLNLEYNEAKGLK